MVRKWVSMALAVFAVAPPQPAEEGRADER